MKQALPSIVYISDSTSFGGSEKYLFDVASHFAGQTTVRVLMLGPGCPELEAQLDSQGITIDRIGHTGTAKQFYHGFKYLWQYRRHLIHFNLTYFDACRSLAMALPFLPQLKTVATIHGLLPQPDATSMSQKIKRQIRYRLFRGYGRILSPSAYVARELARSWGADAQRIMVVHNGVIPPLGLNPPRKKPAAVLTLLYLGRLSEEKGPRYLVEALAALPTNTVRCLMVGDGPQMTEIEQLVAKHQLSPYITLVGYTRQYQDYLAQSDVLVLPSQRENFPLSILEAMSAGLAVIAANVGGVSEQVVDGQTGFLFPARDVSSLADRINTLLRQPSRAVDMGQQGQKIYRASFTLDHMIAAIQQQYLQFWNQ